MDTEQCIITWSRFKTLCNEKKDFDMVWIVNNMKTTLEVRFFTENHVFFYVHTGIINIEMECKASCVDVLDVEGKDDFITVTTDNGYLSIHADAIFYDRKGEEISF